MRWSDLPMSGSFVEMLRRIVDASGYTSNPGPGVAGEARSKRSRRCERWMGSAPSDATLDRRSRCLPISGTGGDRPSARLLRSGRWPARGQCAGGGGSHRALDTSGLRARHASYTNSEPRDLRGMLRRRRWRCS